MVNYKELERANKIVLNADYIKMTLDIMETQIQDLLKEGVNLNTEVSLNVILDNIRYLQESYFYPINNKEND